MSETNRSQSQHENPFAKTAAEQLGRTEAAFAEYAKLEEQMLEQARVGIEESARLTKESLVYASSLMAQWRRFSLEAVRRTADMFPKA
jgi:hypothetical protein